MGSSGGRNRAAAGRGAGVAAEAGSGAGTICPGGGGLLVGAVIEYIEYM